MTVGGISLVVFVFTAVLMLANGLEKTLVSTGQNDNVVVIRKSAQSEMMSAVDRDNAGYIKTMPEIALSTDNKPVVSSEVNVIINLFKNGSGDMGNVTARGVSPEAYAIRKQVRFTEGRAFRPGTPEIIVGSAIAKRFQGIELGKQLRFGTRDWTIVGIFDAGGSAFDSEIWGDVEQLMPAFGRPVFSAMILHLNKPEDFETLKARFDTEPRLNQLEVKREQQFYSEQSGFLATFIRVLGLAVTITFSFGAVIGAAITMYAAVANRTVEIGTLRALGFRRRSILTAFLFEAIALSLLGWIIGVLLAMLLQSVTLSTTNFQTFSEIAFGFTMTTSTVISSLVFSVFMGIVGGFMPAVRAARLNIVSALRAG
jgi:ABC-type lipoprotein release transport system permease subunit